jgi:hypothetical protein
MLGWLCQEHKGGVFVPDQIRGWQAFFQPRRGAGKVRHPPLPCLAFLCSAGARGGGVPPSSSAPA